MRFLSDHFARMCVVTGAGVRRDGLAFERLVFDLLRVSRLSKDGQTAWQHLAPRGGADGARDFERLANGRYEWAEAKHYQDKIALKQLGPTLVVAKNEDVARLIIFSVSRLNENTVRHIAHYQASAGMAVEIFDDESLEDLILSVLPAALFRRHFHDAPPPRTERPWTAELTSVYSRDPDIEYWDEADHWFRSGEGGGLPILDLQLGDTISHDIFLRNTNPLGRLTGRLNVGAPDARGCLTPLTASVRDSDGWIPVDLAPGELRCFRVHYRADSGSSKVFPLPDVWLQTAAGEDSPLRATRAITHASVRSFLRPPIVGHNAGQFLERTWQLFTTRGRPRFIGLSGGSGTGKTRLLRALRDYAFTAGRPVFLASGENGGASRTIDLLRNFVSRRYRIPIFDEPLAFQHGGGTWRPDTLADRILLDSDFNPAAEIDTCADFLAQELGRCRGLLLVDNLQAYDQTLSRILTTLIGRTADIAADFGVAVSVNTDFLGGAADAASVIARLDALAGEREASIYVHKLSDFTAADARHLLDDCIATNADPESRFSVIAPQTVALILEKVAPRPLDLLQALRLLDQEGAACRQPALTGGGDRLYVRDIDAFHKLLATLPRRIESILQRRWAALRQATPNPEGLITTVRALTLFLRLPRSALQSFEGVTDQNIDHLLGSGMIEVSEDNRLVFEHRKVRDYLHQITGGLPGMESFYRAALQMFERQHLRPHYNAQYFMVQAALFRTAQTDLMQMADVAIRGHVPVELAEEFSQAWCEGLQQLPASERLSIAISKTSFLAAHINRHVGFQQSLTIFQSTLSDVAQLHDVVKLADIDGTDYARTIVAYGSNLLRLRRDDQALALLQQAERNLRRLAFPTRRRRLTATAMIKNRLCVAYRSVLDLPTARRYGLEVCRIGKAIGDPYIRRQGHIDLGYTYYGSTSPAASAGHHRRALLRHWRAATEGIDLATAPADGEITHARVFLYHRMHVAVLEHRWVDAEALLLSAAARCEKDADVFHLVKLFIMYAVTHMLDRSSSTTSALCHAYIDRAADLCQSHRANQSYWVSFFARAMLWHFQGSPEARDLRDRALVQALEQITAALGAASVLYGRFQDFFYQSIQMLSARPSGDIKSEARQILASLPDIRMRLTLLALLDGEHELHAAPQGTYMLDGYVLPTP